MLRRLLSLVIILVVLFVAYEYWQTGRFSLPTLENIKSLRTPDLKKLPEGLKDAAITGSVRTALSLNRELAPYKVEVEAKDAVVVLKGALPSADLKGMAKQVAEAVPNVKSVSDEIKVDPQVAPAPEPDRTMGERLDDESLIVQVKLALSLKKELDGASIHVDAFKKAVTLSGTATPPQKVLALKTASDTPGVLHVTDSFGSGEPGLGKGREAAERALAGNPNLAQRGIRVVENEGRLSLRGTVRTGAEKDLAQLIAERAAGVSVDNLLELKP
jgi:osmotically-inducible protein OsmY